MGLGQGRGRDRGKGQTGRVESLEKTIPKKGTFWRFIGKNVFIR
jgi:hypothetical protein